jgi:hypothetical protein
MRETCSGRGLGLRPPLGTPTPKGKSMAIVRNRGKNARNVSQKIWLNSAEVEKIREAAGDVPIATWLRDLALGQPSKPRLALMQRKTKKQSTMVSPEIQPLAVAVAKVGNNLNQIARAVNASVKVRKPIDAVLIANQLAQIRREMKEELRAVNEKFIREVKVAGTDI